MAALHSLRQRLPLLALLVALAAVAAFAYNQFDASPVSAHQDPPSCTTVGNSISLSKLRDTDADNIGDTLIPGAVIEGETIYFETTLAERPNVTDCAIGGGDLFIDPPGAVGPTDVTPSGVPCIGGTFDGVGAINECDPAPMCPEAAPQSCFTSDQLGYEVDCEDTSAGFLPIATNWSGGINHNAAHSPASASQSDAVECLAPAIRIIKTAGSAVDGALETVEAGDQVVFHYEVCNTGEVALIVTHVTDDNGTPGNPGDDFTVAIPGPDQNFEPGECENVDSDPVTIADTGTMCETPRINIASVSGTSDPGGIVVMDDDPASVCALTPGIRIIKTANAAPDGSVLEISEGVAITFHYEVCNTGETDLTVTQVTDDNGTPGVPGDDFTVPVPAADQLLTPGECIIVHSDPMTPTLPTCGQTRVNTATVVGTTPAQTTVTDTDDAAACQPPAGGEGCTPGYWKQEHHFDSWVGYSPNQLFSSVFEDAFPGMTLLDVLWQGGGGLKALGRHTVAALLNASSGGVDYEFTTAEVIQAFNNTYPAVGAGYEIQKNIFAQENERGCPLN